MWSRLSRSTSDSQHARRSAGDERAAEGSQWSNDYRGRTYPQQMLPTPQGSLQNGTASLRRVRQSTGTTPARWTTSTRRLGWFLGTEPVTPRG